MNKIFLSALFLIFSAFCFESSAQTVRYYTAQAVYDKDGIKHSPNDFPEIYLAFVQNNNLIYQCHKDGSSRGSMYQWRYVTTKDNIRVYQATPNIHRFTPYPWLYITPDYSRVNLVRWERNGTQTNFDDPGWTYVFQQSDPNQLGAPSVFY